MKLDEKQLEALQSALELLHEISRDEVNHQDEAEKWLRAYQHCVPAKAINFRRKCKKCLGYGFIEIQNGPYTEACPTCNGTGKI